MQTEELNYLLLMQVDINSITNKIQLINEPIIFSIGERNNSN
jgi:hypothetical protein